MEIFAPVKGFFKSDPINIDHYIFRLHCKVTFILLVAFSLMVTSKQCFGDPITCIVDEDIPDKAINTYCWIHSTFTVPDRMASEVIGRDVPHPGLGIQRKGDSVKYHKYYQWVCFVLFFQAVLFYLPCYLWKIWEGGKMKSLVLDLNCPIIGKDNNNKLKLLVDYLTTHVRQQNSYAFGFVICEILNFINVIWQMFFINSFLGGEFITYGSDVIQMTQLEERVDPMAKIFPKVTKCTFHTFGPSGAIQKIDALCLLPLNIVNEKIYVFLWFWFIILALFSGLTLLYRAVVLFSSRARLYLLRNKACMAPGKEVELIARKIQFGDWFVLLLLAKNMDPYQYKLLISELALQFKKAI